jgi:hypothetical protein
MVGNATARYIGTAISLVSPTEALWRLALHVLQPPVMSQIQVTPFSRSIQITHRAIEPLS